MTTKRLICALSGAIFALVPAFRGAFAQDAEPSPAPRANLTQQEVERSRDAGPKPPNPDEAEEKKESAEQKEGAPGGKKKKAAAESHPIHDLEPPPGALPPKREKPDYSGRGPEPTTAGDVLLWGPRLAVAPLYLTTEFLIRRPLTGLLRGIEQSGIVQRFAYVFTFGGTPKVGIIPTFFVDFGLLPSAGFYFFWDDAFADHNHVRVHFGTWGPDWLNVAVADRYDVSENSTAALRASFVRRSDYTFYGLGPDSREQLRSRYGARTLDAGPTYEMRVEPWLVVRTAAGARSTQFEEGTCCTDVPLTTRIANGELAAPPRYFDGYTAGYQRAELAFDSRPIRPKPQSGARLALQAEPATDLSHRPGVSWLRYSATAGAFWDVTGKARVLSLTANVSFADPISGPGDAIPLTELVQYGGDTWMRGFLPGRLVGRSGATGTLGYQFPVWAFLDGTLQASVGNVFGAGLRGLDPERMRLSTGFGFRTNNSPDHQFEALIGFGTDTFEQGGAVSSFRLALGATRGF